MQWDAIRKRIVRDLRSSKSLDSFARMKGRNPFFRRFAEPNDVISFLRLDNPAHEKNQLLKELVVLAKPHQAHTELATLILLLGLWGGLDGIYRSHNWRFSTKEAASDAIIERFIEVLGRSEVIGNDVVCDDGSHLADSAMLQPDVARPDASPPPVNGRHPLARAPGGMRPKGIVHVAATLVGNTRRSLRKIYLPRLERDSKLDPLLDDLDFSDEEPTSARGPIETLEAADLYRGMVELVGKDAELMWRVIVLEQTRAQAANELGMSDETGRKRYQRALAQLLRSPEITRRALGASPTGKDSAQKTE